MISALTGFYDSLGSTGQFALWSFVKIAIVFGVVMTMVAYAVLAERKISAFIQDRQGPNRVSLPLIGSIPVLGPFLTRLGIWQPLADGVKSFLKEDFTPDYVRKAYYWIAPAITFIPALLAIAIIPFGSNLNTQKMVIADLDIGILFTFGVVSLGVYGIVLAGYSANSKYPFLGSIRSSAQMISYEIAMGMSVVPIFLVVGKLNLGEIVSYQAQHGWFIFPPFAQEQTLLSYLVWPFALLSFFIFMVSAFAETNRLPFDLPESETELVAGYNTEYSSMKFALFFMGEYAAIIAGCGLMVTLFLGGWSLPWIADQPATTIGMGIAHILIFLTKTVMLLVLFIWVRWMFPRFRYDQLMNLGWKRFIPMALANVLIVAVILMLVYRPPVVVGP
ncbi:MAG: NADH-quinone oxidoreductase subunit H [Verrucomicrobia bacterium]|nr:NADH-quinone oxidoreductase subunit H [Verrucomicrobiota bacterium]